MTGGDLKEPLGKDKGLLADLGISDMRIKRVNRACMVIPKRAKQARQEYERMHPPRKYAAATSSTERPKRSTRRSGPPKTCSP